MFEHRSLISAFRGFTVAACLAALAGCGWGSSSTMADASAAATSTPTAIPPVPTAVAATAADTKVTLNWTGSSGASGYNVKRATTSGGPYTQIGSPTSSSYTDSSLTDGTTYYYVVSALDSAGESADSAQVSAVPKSSAATISIPAAPTGLSAIPGNAQVSLNWSASSGATSYHVKRATVSGGPYTQVGAPNTASYTDSSLTNGTTYYYVVSAVNSAGESTNSAPINASPTAPAQVGDCDNLPAAGVWQNITPVGNPISGTVAVNGTVGAAIIVDPFDPRTVWLGTGAQNEEIWRSDNCGSTWTRVDTGPGSVGDHETYGGVGDGTQWSMQIDPVTPDVLYATSGYGAESLWKTTDGGYSWTDILANTVYDSVAQGRFVNNVSLDPTDHLHLVVSTHGSCAVPYAPTCIGESHDGGSTWTVLTAPVSWGEGGGLILVKGGLWIWCGGGETMLVTTDGGSTWSSNVLANGAGCEAEYTIRAFVPASNGNYYLGSRNGVLRSPDGQNWTPIPGTSGTLVAVAQGSKRAFAANQWHPQLKWASLDNDSLWTDLPTPPQISQGVDGGIPFIAYDDAHGILYASMFSGGVARMVIQ